MRPTYLYMKKYIIEYKQHVCKATVKKWWHVHRVTVAHIFEISASEFEASMRSLAYLLL